MRGYYHGYQHWHTSAELAEYDRVRAELARKQAKRDSKIRITASIAEKDGYVGDITSIDLDAFINVQIPLADGTLGKFTVSARNFAYALASGKVIF